MTEKPEITYLLKRCTPPEEGIDDTFILYAGPKTGH